MFEQIWAQIMRIAQTAKMGYVPTPPSQTDLIEQFLSFPSGVTRIFDPCAGAGECLAQIAKGNKDVVTYGIELDGARAEQASLVLNHVKHCAIERARIDKQSFSMMLLNPPYDAVANGEQASGLRKELLFLRSTSAYLVPDGILVFIIPQPQITKDLASALVGRYRDISVYRFTDDEYDIYKQIVIFGTRRSGAIGAGTDEDKAMYKYLVEIGEGTKDLLPTLDVPDRVYQVPVSKEEEPLFRANATDVRELVDDINASPVFDSVEKVLGLSDNGVKLAQPLLPFRRTHMATLMAAGALNGAVGLGENRHLVVGVSKKTTTTVKDEENNKDVVTESYKSIVRLFLADGTIRDIE